VQFYEKIKIFLDSNVNITATHIINTLL